MRRTIRMKRDKGGTRSTRRMRRDKGGTKR
jgi:hypothetical protein